MIKVFLASICLLIGATTFEVSAFTKQTLKIAVASNFAPVAEQIFKDFEALHPNIKLTLISGATGTLYQQIRHGAPFDILLSADSIHTTKLVNEGFASRNSQRTYAIGQLALYSSEELVQSTDILAAHIGRIAIANPDIAPYGKAAKQALESLGYWENYQSNRITGVNINQTFQQVRSGAVGLGVVAQSQLKMNNLDGFTLNTELYEPLIQQLVILNKAPDSALLFSDFILAEAAQLKVTESGYLSPQSLPRR